MMQLSFLILLGCLALTCLAFPARDFTIPTDPDRDDVLVPERQLPEDEYRRRRSAQMNPGQGQPAESEQPSTPTEGQASVHPMTQHLVPEEVKPEETRRRRNAQMELEPRIRQPLEKDISDDHPPVTPQPPTEKPSARRRRSAQVDTSEGMSQKKDLTMPQPSEPTTEQSPEQSGAEGQSPESTTEMPLEEEGGMKPVDARRRRNAQAEMVPILAQQQQNEQIANEQSSIAEDNESADQMSEETRRRRSAQMEMVPRIREPLEEDTSEAPMTAQPIPAGKKPSEARGRRNAQAEIVPILAQQQQNAQVTTEQPSIAEDNESGDQMSEGIRRRRNAQMELEPRIRQPLEKDISDDHPPVTPQPPTEKPSARGRRYAQMETSEGMSQKKDLTMPQPSESTTESPESTEEMPLGEEGGMKPVDARRRRSPQLEMVPILMAANQQSQIDLSTSEQPSIAEDSESADQMIQGTRRRRHGHGQRGQSNSQEQQLATAQPSSLLSEQARRRRQLEPGFDTLSVLTTEQPLTEGKASEMTTEAASTDSSEEQTSESADIGLGTNQQFEMTKEQQPMNGKQNPGSSSEESSEEKRASAEIIPVETRKRRHAQLAMAPEMNLQTELPTRQASSSIDGKSSESSESAESSEKIVPETRRRRHIPIRQLTSKEAESTTEQPSSEESESRESQQNLPQGNRQRRRAQVDAPMGVQIGGATDLIPTGEPEGERSAYVKNLPPDMQQNEEKTTEHTEESTTDEDGTKTETREEDNSDGFWKRKASLWEHLW